MKFKLEIDCDNAAFQGEYGDEAVTEVSDILSRLAFQLVAGDANREAGNLHDSNGNFVGYWTFTEEQEDDE